MKRVAIGLSGGVDSAVGAALLQDQGHELTGVFLICYNGPGCRTDEDRKDALDVALDLKIPFEVLDYRREYQEKVLEYFKAEYEAGRTPNPDVVCNREIKFGLFYDWGLKNGYDYVATGHYARISNRSQQFDPDLLAASHKMAASGCARQSQNCCLLRSKDVKKDQTYFLYQLREEQLKHILFPIGEMTKEEVRRKAAELKLPVAKKPDSQGICFVGEVGVREFLMRMGVKEKVGEVIDRSGQVIGEHKGAWFYTIGQRHGFKVNNKTPDSKPMFVKEKDVETNRLVVGTKEECFRSDFEVDNLQWISKSNTRVFVRIRHGGELIRGKVVGSRVELDKPVFGVAAGQAVVFYEDDICLGGGIIA